MALLPYAIHAFEKSLMLPLFSTLVGLVGDGSSLGLVGDSSSTSLLVGGVAVAIAVRVWGKTGYAGAGVGAVVESGAEANGEARGERKADGRREVDLGREADDR